ncbi:MAG: hypothetical protein B7Z61_09380 [Acidobacteria bacterium 37-71-11]|nr:MAG: hypothetical protein B7Z61_09380 [Acidobacteria bacterium 37-71-11]
MDELVIEVERRSSTGKGANRKLRRQGLIPAVVYGGKDKEAVPVMLDRHTVTELLRQEKGRNTVFLLKMKGTKQERHAMVRDAQIDPLTRQYAHLDFIRVIKGQRLKVEIPVVLECEAAGVKIGGFLGIPESFCVDVTNLELGQHIAAAELPLPEGVKLLDDPHKMIATVKTHAKEVEEAKPEEAATAGAETAEPEVIKRGKAVEEGSEDAE